MENTESKVALRIVPPGKKKCIWMEAGVVSYKLCDNNYDCTSCAYDHGMQRKIARKQEAITELEDTIVSEKKVDTAFESWVDKMMKLPASQRKCRYMLTGQVNRKICPNAYECGNCSFDQMMQDRLQPATLPDQGIHQVDGFYVADGYYVHEGHTWARPEHGGRVRIGLDDFVSKLIGKMTGIDLPGIGQRVKQNNAAFQIHRYGNFVSALSPVDGIVTYVNHGLLENPELVIESPYEEGWLFIVEPLKLRKNLKDLYYGKEVEKFIDEEKEKLFQEINEELELAADGGQPIRDILADTKGEDWGSIVRKFLRY